MKSEKDLNVETQKAEQTKKNLNVETQKVDQAKKDPNMEMQKEEQIKKDPNVETQKEEQTKKSLLDKIYSLAMPTEDKNEKDPLLQLLYSLNEFLMKINLDAFNLVKDKGPDILKKLQDTPEVKELSENFDKAQKFVSDKVGQVVEGDLDEVKSVVALFKDNIRDAFSSVKDKLNNIISSGTKNDSVSLSTPLDSVPDSKSELKSTMGSNDKVGVKSDSPPVNDEPEQGISKAL